MSFPKLPWVAAADGLVDSTTLLISPKTVTALCPILVSVPQTVLNAQYAQ